MPKRIIHNLAKGDKISPIWPCYVSFGGITFGILSISSTGGAIILIPMFLTAGAVIGCGMFTHLLSKNKPYGRYLIQIGLALMILSSWTRSISLWNITQNGVGSNFITSIIWVWIILGCGMLFITIWFRGLS